MVRKKTKKFRGSMTHGRGKKGGRGAGLRGGKGNAGLMKHRYMHMVKYMPDHLGKHGFKRPQHVLVEKKIINVGQLEEIFPDKTEINLAEEGYDKLLGGGTIKKAYHITVKEASKKAIEKIEAVDGKITLL